MLEPLERQIAEMQSDICALKERQDEHDAIIKALLMELLKQRAADAKKSLQDFMQDQPAVVITAPIFDASNGHRYRSFKHVARIHIHTDYADLVDIEHDTDPDNSLTCAQLDKSEHTDNAYVWVRCVPKRTQRLS